MQQVSASGTGAEHSVYQPYISTVYIGEADNKFKLTLENNSYNIHNMQPQERRSRPLIPKGRVLYEVGGTPFVVDEKYEIIKQIGSGAYGVVASAINKETKKKVAIKKVGPC